MFDVSKLVVDHMYRSFADSKQFAVYYKYKNKRGLAYVTTNDELGAYQGLLKQLEERYENG